MSFRDGVTRTVDTLGRLVLPIEMRRNYDIQGGERIQVTTEDEWIKIRKVQDRCCICGSDQDLYDIDDKLICRECVEKIRNGL